MTAEVLHQTFPPALETRPQITTYNIKTTQYGSAVDSNSNN